MNNVGDAAYCELLHMPLRTSWFNSFAFALPFPPYSCGQVLSTPAVLTQHLTHRMHTWYDTMQLPRTAGGGSWSPQTAL
jgi:hypothetical protein